MIQSVLRYRLSAICGLLVTVAATGCLTKQGIVMPWTIERQRLESKLDSLSQRLTTMDASFQIALQNSQAQTRADLANQLATLSEEVRALRASLEDYGGRLGRIAERTYRPAPQQRESSGTQLPSGPASTALYDQAYGDYTRGRYEIARQGFQEYLKAYPTSDLSDDARYWIGETYFNQKDYPAAINEFARVTTDYPASEKMPASLYKLGRCYELAGNQPKATQHYQDLIAKFPNSQEAKLAQEALRTLKQ